MPDAPPIDAPPAAPPAPATPPVPAPPPAAPSASPAPPVTPPAPAPPADETPDEKITRLEAAVKAANAEAGKARITAKQTAAEEARKELTQQFGKALGLIPDDNADPVKLLEQANASQAQAKQATIELAVFRAADAADGDPIALLDSRAFLEKVADIEPSDTTALAAAITAAVAENPRLGKTTPAVPPVPGAGMKPNPAQGSSASPPLGLDAQITAAEAAGDWKTAIRLKSAKAVNTSQ